MASLDPTLTLLAIAACAGLTVVITMSHIGGPLRRLFPPPIGCRGTSPQKPEPALLCCPLCTGFWVGLAGGWIASRYQAAPDCFVPMFGFAAALVSYFAGVWLHEHDRPH